MRKLFLLFFVGILRPAIADLPLQTFAPEVLGTASINDVYAAPGGKVYVSGAFTKAGPSRATGNFVRLNADGTLDTAFGAGPTINGTVSRIIPFTDGRFCILGSFTQVAGSVRPGIAILKGDGSLDLTFAPAAAALPGTVTFAALDAGGRILVAGRGYVQQAISAGKWTWLYPTAVVRLLSNGVTDATFTKPTAGLSTDDYPYYFSTAMVGANFVVPLANGKILVGGNFTVCAGVTNRYLALLNADGTGDATFVSPLTVPTAGSYPYYYSYGSSVVGASVAVSAADGGIFVGGQFILTGSAFQQGVVKLKGDLTLDPSFRITFTSRFSGMSDYVTIRRLAADQGGRLAVIGDFYGVEQQGDYGASFVDAYGRPIGPNSAFGSSNCVSIRSDGYAVFGRSGNLSVNGVVQPSVGACFADGTADPAFAPELLGPGQPSFLVARPGNGVLLGGTAVKSVNDAAFGGLTALKADGATDPAFNCAVTPPNSVAFALPLPGGRYLLGGSFSKVNGVASQYLAVVDSAGALVRAVAPADAPSSSVEKAFLLPSGKVLISGYFSKVGGFETKYLAVLNLSQAGGVVDTSFKCVVTNLYSIYAAAGLSDGSILIGGSFSNLGSQGIAGVARLSATGDLDGAFKPLASFEYPYVYGLAVDPSGRAVVGGSFYPASGTTRHLLRVNSDGTLDTTLSEAAVSYVQSLRVEGDFRIYVEGSFNSSSGITGELGRLNDDGSVDNSFSVGQSSVSGFELAPPDTLYLWGAFTDMKGVPRSGVGAFALSAAVPPSVSISPTVSAANLGQKVLTLSVLSRGAAESVQWLKDGEVLSTDLDLVLGPITAEDAGVYTLKVSNVAGTTTVLANVSADGTATTPPVEPTPTPVPKGKISFPEKLRLRPLKRGVQVIGIIWGVDRLEIFQGKNRLRSTQSSVWRFLLTGNPKKWVIRVVATDWDGHKAQKTYVIKNPRRTR